MRLPRLALVPPHHARAQSSAAGRVLVRKPDGSLAYLPRRSLDFSAGFFPEPVSPADVLAARPAEVVVSASEPVAPSIESSSPAELRAAAEVPAASVPTSRVATAKAIPRIVRGVEIPIRPPPPESDECCMSGCARCVYDLYAEDLQDYHAALVTARNELVGKHPPVTAAEWPSELGDRPQASGGGAMELDVKAVAKERADREQEVHIEGLDPSMQVFLAMERRLRRQRAEKAPRAAA